MLPDCNFLSYIIVINNCIMENYIQKNARRLAVLSVGAMFIASFAGDKLILSGLHILHVVAVDIYAYDQSLKKARE